MNTSLLEAVKAVCLASSGTGSNRNFKVGAILFRKTKIYAARSNSYKTHPALVPYTSYPYLHAESACILHRGLDNCEGLDLLVARYRRISSTNHGVVATMAKPCSTCISLVKDVGIRNIYYTNWEGHIEHDKI